LYYTGSQIILLEGSTGDINSKTFIEEVDAFYGSCASYTLLWEEDFLETITYTWINGEFTRVEIGKTAAIINMNHEQAITDIDIFFSNICKVINVSNIKLQHPVALYGSDFAFHFFAVHVQRRLIFSHLLFIVTTCFGLTGHHQVYRLL
jgi:hypothetical protein